MLQENDDMDELLRKAAEKYPLKTDNAGWEKVRLALAAEGFSNEPDTNKNRRSLWVLLLLLPIGWAGYYYISSPTRSDKSVAAKKNTAKNYKISQPFNIKNNTSRGEELTQQNVDQTVNTNPKTIQFIAKNNYRNLVARSNTSFTINQPSDKEDDEVVITINKKTHLNKEENTNQDVINTNNKKIDNNLIEKNNAVVTTDEEKNNEKNIKKNNKNKKQKNNFLYAGVTVGPDISTVKFQSVKNTGVNMGIILGYQLNKKLALETGIVWDKKYYYSDGKYFNTGKIYLPPNAKIINVNGNCKMIEVPINVKYNLKSSGKTTLFATVGLSSYFMKQESYSYTVVSTGAPYPYNKTYKKSSQYLLSDMNVSAGYNHSLGKTGTLRFEPYIKIPLKGVGIGSLPITSVGINVGITKKIF